MTTLLLVPLAESTFAGIVTAVATMFTALGGMILAVSVLLPILRSTRQTQRLAKETADQVKVVHTIVNQRFTDQDRYIIALTQQIIGLGAIPNVDQSRPVPGMPDARPGQPTDPPPLPTPPVQPLPVQPPKRRHRKVKGTSLDPRPPIDPDHPDA